MYGTYVRSRYSKCHKTEFHGTDVTLRLILWIHPHALVYACMCASGTIPPQLFARQQLIVSTEMHNSLCTPRDTVYWCPLVLGASAAMHLKHSPHLNIDLVRFDLHFVPWFQMLNIANNQFEGDLPASLCNVKTLVKLVFHDNPKLRPVSWTESVTPFMHMLALLMSADPSSQRIANDSVHTTEFERESVSYPPPISPKT